jgi:hypothetical protein
MRPASAAKATRPYYEREMFSKFTGYERSTKPEMNDFYRRKLDVPIKDTIYEK